MRTIIRIMALIVVAVSLISIGMYIFNTLQNRKTTAEIQAIYSDLPTRMETPVPEPSYIPEPVSAEEPVIDEEQVHEEKTEYYLIDLRKNPNSELLAVNNDFVGWVRVDGTKVDYPVVKHSDNDFYLTRDFYKENNIAGSIYMDYRNFGNEFDRHIVIYGHNMKNGTMFRSLNYYKEEGFFNDNPIITFSNLYETFQYEIFSVYWVSADDYKLEFNFTDTGINDYFEFLKERSLYQRDSDIEDISQIITLATCSYEVDNGRLMVHGIRID